MRVTLILPDKKNNGEDWEQAGILSSLCQHEGGFTVYPSMEGWYYSESFGIIREVVKIVICESSSSVEYWQGVAREVCALAEQESVFLQFDNDAPQFVSAQLEAVK